jgi:sulfate transport system permease protein
VSLRQPSILPGFGLTFGFTTSFLSTIVLLPLAALVLAAAPCTGAIFSAPS